MRNRLTLTLAISSLVLGCSQSSFAQQGSVAPSVVTGEERTTREQDGLEGPVRRVRVESAKVMVKAGQLVEGPRAIRGIATYDSLGKKIDSVDYPVESSTVPGKERYRYDDKGNIVEMVVLGPDNSILSKEAYDYEFDPVGNWIKMNTSVAVYENGKVTFEPTEVTYRTISYYYNQAIEKLGNAAAKKNSAASSSKPANEPQSLAKATSKSITANRPLADKVAADAKETVTNPAPVSPPANITPAKNTETLASDAAPKNEKAVEPAAPAKPSVVKIDEVNLRAAAMELPQPEYPDAALLSRVSGKVEVQLLIDENGNVTNARAQTGNPMLTQAAENAARKAKFFPTKLTAEPAVSFGVITYNFTAPEPPKTNLASKPAAENKPPIVNEKPAAPTQPVTFTETKTKSGAEAEESNYRKGVTFLNAGHYEEAADLLHKAVQADPNDATAYAKLAMSYTGLNKDKEAIATYKMASQISKTAIDAAAYFNWGKSYLALDKNSDAISALKQSLSLMRAEAIGLGPSTPGTPTQEQVHHYLGTAYINSSRFNDSIKEFKQVVAVNPANAEAHFALAISYINTGDSKNAEAETKIVSSLDPEMAKKLKEALSNPTSRYGCNNVGCRR